MRFTGPKWSIVKSTVRLIVTNNKQLIMFNRRKLCRDVTAVAVLPRCKIVAVKLLV